MGRGSRVSRPRKVPCFYSLFITVPGFNPYELYLYLLHGMLYFPIPFVSRMFAAVK